MGSTRQDKELGDRPKGEVTEFTKNLVARAIQDGAKIILAFGRRFTVLLKPNVKGYVDIPWNESQVLTREERQ